MRLLPMTCGGASLRGNGGWGGTGGIGLGHTRDCRRSALAGRWTTRRIYSAFYDDHRTAAARAGAPPVIASPTDSRQAGYGYHV
jgi:hypothetical protein